MHWIKKRAGRLALAAALAVSAASCDFVQPTESDPNAIPEPVLDQLFVGVQVKTFFMAEMQMHRLSAMWLQQMSGTDRQYQQLGVYTITEGDLSGEFSGLYVQGGLSDMRRAIGLAEEQGRAPYAGIIKIHQAFVFGQAASIWGAIPYSQAANPEEFPVPQLDSQREVYNAVQGLLDQAINDLAGAGAGPGSVDLAFGGDTDAWTAVAHSLKARYHLHWNEYGPALAEAQQGISDPSGNWETVHTTTSTEQNLWSQFIRDRDSYIRGGAFLIDLLQARNDPRLPIYFMEGTGSFAGQFVGADPDGGGASVEASQANVPVSQDYGQPVISCAETQFIAAEAALQGGGGDPAAFLAAGVACQETKWGVDIPDPGAATLENIIREKYIANFLSLEVWNDYQRTCLPAITPVTGKIVPRRVYYGDDERRTNSNIPAPGTSGNQIEVGNENDPNPTGC